MLYSCSLVRLNVIDYALMQFGVLMIRKVLL